MVVTVEATTTRGKQMTPSEWQAVEKACEMSFELEDARKKVSTILGYLARRELSRLTSVVCLKDLRVRRVAYTVFSTQFVCNCRLADSDQAARYRWWFDRSKQDAISQHICASTSLLPLTGSCMLTFNIHYTATRSPKESSRCLPYIRKDWYFTAYRFHLPVRTGTSVSCRDSA
jgi:hypothetical protein